MLFYLCAIFFVASASGFTIDANCVAMNYTGAYCENYVLMKLNELISNTSVNYNAATVPSLSSPLNISVQITFNHIRSVDQVAGVITIDGYVDIVWYNEFLTWNSSKTPDVTSVNLPASSVWTPDFNIYNGDSGVTGDLVSVNADGYTWWSRSGEMSFYCFFDLTDFPFDTQSCYMKFGNFQYDITMVDVYPFSTPLVINNRFTSQEYDVLSITVQRRVKKFVEMDSLLTYPFLYYYIDIQRYSNIYRDSASRPLRKYWKARKASVSRPLPATTLILLSLFAAAKVPNAAMYCASVSLALGSRKRTRSAGACLPTVAK